MKSLKINTSHQKIICYYEKAGLDYRSWSKSFNMHFGYFKWGMNPFNLESMLDEMNRQVLERLQLHTYCDPLVLDLGCGLGATSRYMARRNREASFYGITITPWQIEFGEKLNRQFGLDRRINFIQSDFTGMPLVEEAAEAAFAIESACYAEGSEKRDFIKELYRVLRSGGRFVITDGFKKHSRPLPRLLEKIYRRNMVCWALEDLAEIHPFVKALKDGGFRQIKVEDISWKVAPSFAHIPIITLKFFWDYFKNEGKAPLAKERRNNALAPLFGMLMGLSRKHFGYYVISGIKP